MRELLKLSIAIAFAWIMSSIPVWLAFSIYFSSVRENIETVQEELRLLNRNLVTSRNEIASFNLSAKEIQKANEEGVENIAAGMSDLNGKVYGMDHAISQKLDAVISSVDDIRIRVRSEDRETKE